MEVHGFDILDTGPTELPCPTRMVRHKTSMGVLHVIVVLLSFLCCILSSGGFHIPEHQRHSSGRSRAREREAVPQGSRRNGESRAFAVFSSLRARHYREHRDDAVFAASLFELFDINNDGIIELNEFFTTLQFLGMIDIDYMS
ncbi:uncharacterized protein LOC135492287 [Lineus longissimus]|uniref:uncharacterized protein LOC135492287 n=1 Tax=Lineus longissimus TaxID=88925 RepID=UPI002B4F3682